MLWLAVGRKAREACSREACGRVGVAKGAGTGEPPPAGSGGRVGPSDFFWKIKLKSPLERSIFTKNASIIFNKLNIELTIMMIHSMIQQTLLMLHCLLYALLATDSYNLFEKLPRYLSAADSYKHRCNKIVIISKRRLTCSVQRSRARPPCSSTCE